MGIENNNWDLCCFFEDRLASNDLWSTKTDRETLGKQLILFKNLGAVLPDRFSGSNESVVLRRTIKKCHNKYNNYHLTRLKESVESNGDTKSVPVKSPRN